MDANRLINCTRLYRSPTLVVPARSVIGSVLAGIASRMVHADTICANRQRCPSTLTWADGLAGMTLASFPASSALSARTPQS